MTKTLTNQTKAIGYIRVSTTEQATEGVSLADQREKIQAYCELHDLQLQGIHHDNGISGKRLSNRAGVQAALKAVCHCKGVLVVYSLTRLARSTRDCIEIVDSLDKCGADLASISEKIDTTSSMGRFFFRLMASLGELERDQVSERTKSAMAYKRSQGERISGHIPFGFDLAADSVKLKRNQREQRVISRIVKLRNDGLTYRAIAADLNGRDIPAKAGGQWFANPIMDICKREIKLATE